MITQSNHLLKNRVLFVHLPRTNSCTPRTQTLLLLFHVRAVPVPLPPLQVILVLELVLFVVQGLLLKVFPLVPQVVVAVLFVVRVLKAWPLVLVVRVVAVVPRERFFRFAFPPALVQVLVLVLLALLVLVRVLPFCSL